LLLEEAFLLGTEHRSVPGALKRIVGHHHRRAFEYRNAAQG
jgi:hypothetical protein